MSIYQTMDAGDQNALRAKISDAMQLLSLDAHTTMRHGPGMHNTHGRWCWNGIRLSANDLVEIVAAVIAPPAEPELTATMPRSLPGGTMDDSTFSTIEDALDEADAPMMDGERWLTLTERIAALGAMVKHKDTDFTKDEVIREDRKAAEDMLEVLHPDHGHDADDPIYCLGINLYLGNEDSHPYVQAFRAYRLQTVSELTNG